jgi:cell division protein FtsX
MIKQYFKQALAQLRQHPLISVISIAGTALSIFLIMLVVMLAKLRQSLLKILFNHLCYILINSFS